jgi:hypothetical protein
VATFSKELGAPVAGGVLHQGGKQEWAQAQLNPKKGRQGGGGGARGFSDREGGHGGGNSQSSGEVAALPGSKAGQEATVASEVPFPLLNQTNDQHIEELTGEVLRRWKRPNDPTVRWLHVVTSSTNGERVVRECWWRPPIDMSTIYRWLLSGVGEAEQRKKGEALSVVCEMERERERVGSSP